MKSKLLQNNKSNKFSRYSISIMIARLISLAIILLPFNDLPILLNLAGEISLEGAFYPIVIAIVIFGILLLKNKSITIPKNIGFYSLILLCIWIVIIGVIDIPNMQNSYYKGSNGFTRYINQLLVLVFGVMTTYITYSVFRVIQLDKFRKYILISFYIAGAYSLIELIYLLSNGNVFKDFLEVINQLIHRPDGAILYSRLRSVSGEASWFAMYFGVAFSWIVITYINNKKYIYLLLYSIIMIIFTESRLGYMLLIIQIFILLINKLYINSINKKRFKSILMIIPMVTIISGYVLLFPNNIILETIKSLSNFNMNSSNMHQVYSNITRFGAQGTAIKMGLDNPIKGVGFGQYAFNALEYTSEELLLNSEINAALLEEDSSVWAVTHSIHARVFAETGFVGLLLWINTWIYTLIKCIKIYRKNLMRLNDDYIGLALIISIIGCIIVGFNQESFRFFGYWIILGFSWSYIIDRNNKEINNCEK